MANPEHLAILSRGVSVWNAWRAENPDVRPDLNRAKLSGAHLQQANLTGAHLIDADLTRAYLYRADLTRANFTGY